jgi:fumarate hydratase class I
MPNNLNKSILELIRKTSTELPKDVAEAVHSWQKKEAPGSRARYAMDIICENLKLAEKASQPICQDTGSILFFVKAPVGFNQSKFEEAAKWAVAEATAKGYLRQNSVDSLTGNNSGNNLGPGFPHFHFEQFANALTNQRTNVRLILKGGGCENCGAQYSLPDKKLNAQRNLAGVRKCILDCVLQAQGKGCAPGVLGACVGGDRATGYLHSKEQLLRLLTDINSIPELAKMEAEILEKANTLGIGPMGFGGETTLLGCKIGALNRVPASFFVSISYMCWADRRQGVELDSEGKIVKWLY